MGFNPAEAEEGFRSKTAISYGEGDKFVSIQPKPKKGLEVRAYTFKEASKGVSIQPKPKKGLEVEIKY